MDATKPKTKRARVKVSQLAKLNSAQVKAIRQLYHVGRVSQSAIARQFNVSQPTISNIVAQKIYRSV